MTNARIIPHESYRVETGPVQFGDDWPGIFIRGDSAFAYGIALAQLARNPRDAIAAAQVRNLADLLATCHVGIHQRQPGEAVVFIGGPWDGQYHADPGGKTIELFEARSPLTPLEHLPVLGGLYAPRRGQYERSKALGSAFYWKGWE